MKVRSDLLASDSRAVHPFQPLRDLPSRSKPAPATEAPRRSSSSPATPASRDIYNGGLPYSVENPFIQSSDWAWAIESTRLRYTLNRFYDRYRIPLFIVEDVIKSILGKNTRQKKHDPV